jgi:dTDP-4-dehydrorhamnose reductase
MNTEHSSHKQAPYERILITGGMGFFGWNAANHFRRRGLTPIVSSSSPTRYPAEAGETSVYMNILDRVSIEACLRHYAPTLILHAAAFSAPLACEKDPALAHEVNVIGTQNMIAMASEFDIPLVFTSTDLVFNGEKDVLRSGFYTEADTPDASIVYGKTKIAAERCIQEQSFGKWIILRSALMFGQRVEWANGFPQFAVDLLKSGKPTTLFTDQFRTPAYIPDITEAIICLLRAGRFGEIYHCGGAERIDRVSFVQRYCAVASVETTTIIACTMDDVPDYTTKVLDVSLSNEKLLHSTAHISWQVTPFETAFREMLL